MTLIDDKWTVITIWAVVLAGAAVIIDIICDCGYLLTGL